MRLIEAEELKHLLNNSKYYGTKAGNAFADMITECNTIEVRKTGKWLREQLALPLSDGSKECVRCSSCLTHWDNESNYCPNCGAAMNGSEAAKKLCPRCHSLYLRASTQCPACGWLEH